MSTLKVNNLTDLGADAVVTNGVIAASALPAGSILQVLSAHKSDTFSTASATFVDVTGLSVTITPTSASSKILLVGNVETGGPAASTAQSMVRLIRDATPINIGDAAGSRAQSSSETNQFSTSGGMSVSLNYLDSPATTSAVTYKVQYRVSAGATVYINRTGADSDGATDSRMASNFTVMEVAG